MNKIFSSKQIASIDEFTIQNEPIADIDLMERASLQIVNWMIQRISNERKLLFFVGPGNNGGDALAIARLMAEYDYSCSVFILDFGKPLKGSPEVNEERLKEQGKVGVSYMQVESDFPEVESGALIIDGLFGSGLNRPLEGVAAELVAYLNHSSAEILAIDIPSGLFAEDNSSNNLDHVIRANFTLTFQFPKLSFFFPEHEAILGEWEVLPIGLHPEAISKFETPYGFASAGFVAGKLKSRARFSHKGTYGHALLIAGAYGKMGAAVLASKACLRSGTGLLTTHVPHSGAPILQTAVPEAMCSIDASDLMFTEFPKLEQFSAVGIGPGIGTKPNSQRALRELLLAKPGALVIDADAINILAAHPEWYELLPEHTVLTPHPKEFERLVGPFADSYTRLQLQREFSQKYKVVVALKGAFTSVSFPDGNVCFNTTGNPGMATAGSGDVLTGIVLGLLAQGYTAVEATLLAVWLHGLAGDLAAQSYGYESLIAGDITENLGKAFCQLKDF
ncbi:NAD(P)H-hydrate dehydratase [Mangrovibacterium diazotrophicum]|uniref:Bifunctional NAD(P)H-hydrate repair enzyme n=1 Tax=Mangrovibacterium diazotrophicum TaxID=1261403 RepID=A0A419W722_9BACT|nr:NAD(P)H-hydrate dehydratase [Mangrovibacterium diazotrophicum]RKD91259.1 NAD(P)H-hydrate epimerase [Mangrovibacterium diazotrophicum]